MGDYSSAYAFLLFHMFPIIPYTHFHIASALSRGHSLAVSLLSRNRYEEYPAFCALIRTMRPDMTVEMKEDDRKSLEKAKCSYSKLNLEYINYLISHFKHYNIERST